jgi:kumamolisin
MTEPQATHLPGSERQPLANMTVEGPVDPSERMELTLITRRAQELPQTADGSPARLSRDDLRATYGSAPDDQDLVASVLTGLDPAIEVVSTDPGSRRMTVAGPASALTAAFGTQLEVVTSPDAMGNVVRHRYRSGPLQVPAELSDVIVAVLGMDTRPQAAPHFRFHAEAAAQVSYTAVQIADLYQFPAGTNGAGQTIGIIELGGGFGQTDLDNYFSALGIPTPSVRAVGVDGATNVPGQAPQGADGEVLLDIEVAGAVAPGANQVVYFAPNTDQGFIDAVTDAVHAQPTPAAVSISWGGPENSWTAASMTALDQAIADGIAIGVTVTVAAGDNGSSDGVNDGEPHVDFPASSPHALACGGTSLQADPATGSISSETVWNDGPGGGGGATGGGVSVQFARPAWQNFLGVPLAPGGGAFAGRGVPDVAGNADPATGYQVLVDGNQTVIGGTSAVAPLWAGLIARFTQSVGDRLGLLQSVIYTGLHKGEPSVGLRDITVGSNGAYKAEPGWDACSGLGVPEGQTLLGRFSGGAADRNAAGAGEPVGA